MLTPFQAGALHIALTALGELDDLLCKDDTCQKACNQDCAESCASHSQADDCVTMWQGEKLAIDAACEPCQEHIIIQQADKMLRGIKRKRK